MRVCRNVDSSWLLMMLSFFLGLVGCQPGEGQNPELETDSEEARPVVIAINYPLASVAYQLAGEWVDVQCLVPAGEDPAFWTPDDSQISILQQADLFLLNGAGYEPWRERVTLSPLNLTWTSRGFHDQWIRQNKAVTHQHGPEGKHVHSGFASTTWLDPILFQEQIYVVGQSLVKLLPEQREEITVRVKRLQEKLGQLDQQWKSLTEKMEGRALLASHPVYQYLQKRYGWKLQSLHWEPSQKLTDQQWISFDQLQEKSKANLMLWEDEPGPEIREELNKRGVSVIIVKPLGNGLHQESVFEQMQENVSRFEAMLREN